jgi:hypothetical protein
VVSISSYIPGDGTEGEQAAKPKPLVTTHVATARDAHAVGVMARVEAERRGYPHYRAKGWPIGSGVTEAGVKQFNKRVKGSEQFWHEEGVEPILALRAA